MDSFAPTEERLAVTTRRHPGFPREAATLARLIRHVNRHVNDGANAALKPWGLTYPEYSVLMMLYGTEGYTLNPGQLADATGEKSANITRLTNQLFDKGLLERSAGAGDRRKVTLTLSDAGLARIESFMPDVIDLLHQQTRGLGPAESAQLRHLLKKLLKHLDLVQGA